MIGPSLEMGLTVPLVGEVTTPLKKVRSRVDWIVASVTVKVAHYLQVTERCDLLGRMNLPDLSGLNLTNLLLELAESFIPPDVVRARARFHCLPRYALR
jgi:hypothetical protein